jgi:hypothetical protein
MTMFTPKTELEAILRSALDKRTEELDAASAEIARLREALQMAHQTMSAVVEFVPADFVSTFLDVLEDNRKILQEKP